MEHPLQVEEFSPADALRVALAVAGRCTALAARRGAVAAASGHTGKRGAVPETFGPAIPQFSARSQFARSAQPGVVRSLQKRTGRRRHDRLGR
jgi:hypothetical protein